VVERAVDLDLAGLGVEMGLVVGKRWKYTIACQLSNLRSRQKLVGEEGIAGEEGAKVKMRLGRCECRPTYIHIDGLLFEPWLRIYNIELLRK
jgi:hypothetical protein